MPQTKSQDDLDAVLNGDSAGGDLDGTYPNPTIGGGKVDTTALKTATSEISRSSTGATTLAGGEYAFRSRYKKSSGSDINWVHDGDGAANANFGSNLTTSYTGAYVSFGIQTGTCFAQARYVTSSGVDHWIFLLLDKITKEIISATSAPDHPSYGNGGNSEKVSHPFGDYDETKHEVILLDKETCNQLKNEATEEKSILTLVNEEYKPNMNREEVYVPLHSGKFLGEAPVMIDTILDYIKVRKLIKLTQQEKDTITASLEANKLIVQQERVQMIQNKTTAISKLKVLNFTDGEINALIS